MGLATASLTVSTGPTLASASNATAASSAIDAAATASVSVAPSATIVVARALPTDAWLNANPRTVPHVLLGEETQRRGQKWLMVAVLKVDLAAAQHLSMVPGPTAHLEDWYLFPPAMDDPRKRVYFQRSEPTNLSPPGAGWFNGGRRAFQY